MIAGEWLTFAAAAGDTINIPKMGTELPADMGWPPTSPTCSSTVDLGYEKGGRGSQDGNARNGSIAKTVQTGVTLLVVSARAEPGGSRPVGLDRGPSPRLERDGIRDLAEKPGLPASAGALRRAMRRGFTESLRPIPVSFRCGGCGGR